MQMRAKMISVGLLGAAILLPIDFAKADQLGHASWYSLPANMTANGERMNPNELTAAHRSLPFGTRVLVENLANGRSVVVRINDRGPFIGGRIIDLSKAAAASIGMIESGTAKVRVTSTGGSALAALGETTTKAKAKAGAAQAAEVRADISAAKAASKVRAAARTSPKAKTVAAKASAGTTRLARKPEAKASVNVASTKRVGVRNRVAATSSGVRAAAYQTSSLPAQRPVVASNPHPYAILGANPGFMKPGRSRRTG
jgi:rare lipoprotein A